MVKKMFVVLFSIVALLTLTACADDVDEIEDKVDEIDTADEADDVEEEIVEVKPHHLEEVDEPLDGLEVHFIDTGQSEDILIRSAEATILMNTAISDTSYETESPIPYLESQLVDEIDLLISTSGRPHYHHHLPDILERFPIKESWMPTHEPMHGLAENIYNETLAAFQTHDISPYTPLTGETRTIGDIHLEVIYSASHAEDPLIVKVTYGDMSYMLAGMGEHPISAEVWQSDVDLRSTVWKASYHSQHNNVEFLKAVDPKVAIILSGESTLHPHHTLIDRIDAFGIDEYGTLGHGTIVISTDGKSYHIETETKPTSVDPYHRPDDHKPRSLKK